MRIGAGPGCPRESIAKPLKEYSTLVFNPVCAFFWGFFVFGPIGLLLYMAKMRQRIVDDLMVNMVDVSSKANDIQVQFGIPAGDVRAQIGGGLYLVAAGGAGLITAGLAARTASS